MSIEKDNIEKKVIQKLKTIQDIELPISIYDLGLIYKTDVELKDKNVYVNIETTMINSRCNSTHSFTKEIINNIKSIDEVGVLEILCQSDILKYQRIDTDGRERTI